MAGRDHSFDVTAGDLEALKAVVRRRSAHHLSWHDTQDIASEVALAATVTVSNPSSTAPFMKVAHTHAKQASYYSRSSRKAYDWQSHLAEARTADESGFDPASGSDFTLDVAVRDILTKLPAALARPLVLCDMCGFTLDAASKVLGVPVPTLQRRRCLARVAFAEAWTLAA